MNWIERTHGIKFELSDTKTIRRHVGSRHGHDAATSRERGCRDRIGGEREDAGWRAVYPVIKHSILVRHFLARMFDSEMFSTRGEWSRIAVSAFALAVTGWHAATRSALLPQADLPNSGKSSRRGDRGLVGGSYVRFRRHGLSGAAFLAITIPKPARLHGLGGTACAVATDLHRAVCLGDVAIPRDMMVSQMAAALTLLLITGILARGNQRAFASDVGFDPAHLYTISLDPVRDGYSGAQAAAFFSKLIERVRNLPSVTSASLSDTSPMWSPPAFVRFSASAAGPGSSPTIGSAEKYAVGAGYFETLGVPIQLGRGFRREDEGAAAVIVNERLARDFWNGKNPLGRRIEIGREALQVVGVTRNAKLTFALGQAAPAIYFPLRPENYARPSYADVTLIARTAPGGDGLEVLRREIAALDSNLMPFYAFRTPDQVDRLMYASRIGVSIHIFEGVFGLILAMIGLAGMTAYSVAQRGREIGIRVALGARKADVLGLVMREGAVLVTVGGVIGLAAAWAAMRLLAGITFALAATTGGYVAEPALWVAITLLLAGLALAACYVPARKSLRIDPVVSLRQE